VKPDRDTNELKSDNQAGEFSSRVVRGKHADRQFDIDFWQEQGDEAIFAAVWEMICIAEEAKHGAKPTFDRTITTIKRSQR